MKNNKSILRQGGIYTLATQAAQAITLIAAILSRRFLGPTQTGIWATLQIIVDYSKYTTAGLLSATSLEIPYQIGKGDVERAEKIKNLAFVFVTATSVLIASGMFLFAYLMRGHFRPEVTAGLYFVALVIFLQRFNNLMVGLLRAFKQFHVESHMMVVSAIVNAVLVGILTYYFKIYGFIWAMIFSLGFNILYLFRVYPFRFRWYFDMQMLRPLLKYGVPLMLIGILSTVLKSIDKIVIVRLLGFEQLGIYSIALMACSYMSNFSIAVGIVLIPHFQEKFGARDNPQDLKETIMKSSHAFALGMPVMIYAAWLFSPFFIHLFLPKFLSGIPALRILVCNMFFVALAQTFQDLLVTMKKHFYLFPMLVFTGLLSLGLDVLAIRLGYGIEGIAAATTLSFLIFFTIVFFFCAWQLMSLGEALKKYIYLLCFFLYLLLGFYLTCKAVPLAEAQTIGGLLPMVLCFAAFVLPLVFLMEKNFLLFDRLHQKFKLRKAL